MGGEARRMPMPVARSLGAKFAITTLEQLDMITPEQSPFTTRTASPAE